MPLDLGKPRVPMTGTVGTNGVARRGRLVPDGRLKTPTRGGGGGSVLGDEPIVVDSGKGSPNAVLVLHRVLVVANDCASIRVLSLLPSFGAILPPSHGESCGWNVSEVGGFEGGCWCARWLSPCLPRWMHDKDKGGNAKVTAVRRCALWGASRPAGVVPRFPGFPI